VKASVESIILSMSSRSARGDHLRAVLDEAPDAPLHLVEGAGRTPHLDRTALLQGRRGDIGAEPVGRPGEDPERRGHAIHHHGGQNDDGHDHHRHRENEAERPERLGLTERRGEVQPTSVGQAKRDLERLAPFGCAACCLAPPFPNHRGAGDRVFDSEVPLGQIGDLSEQGIVQYLGLPAARRRVVDRAFLRPRDLQRGAAGQFDDPRPVRLRHVLHEPADGRDALA
jgi:hypothetical protein